MHTNADNFLLAFLGDAQEDLPAADTPPVEPSAPVTPKDESNKDRKRAA